MNGSVEELQNTQVVAFIKIIRGRVRLGKTQEEREI